MFRILCDPSSGSTELCLTEIARSDSQIFFRVLGRIWQRNFELVCVCVCVCVRYGRPAGRTVHTHTHTHTASVSDFGYELDSLVLPTYLAYHMCIQFQITQNSTCARLGPERNRSVSLRMSVTKMRSLAQYLSMLHIRQI